MADTGYSGWVQFDDGEFYVVNYIIDDTHPHAQIRGYAMREEDFYLPGSGGLQAAERIGSKASLV